MSKEIVDDQNPGVRTIVYTKGMIDADGFELIYIDIKSPGQIWRHKLVKETADDYLQVYEVAVDKAKLGRMVKILPTLNQNDPLRGTLFVGVKHSKCPDMIVDDVFIEVKTITGKVSNNTLNNNLKKGQSQAAYVVIRIPEEIEYWRLEFVAKSRFKLHEDLLIIEFKIIGSKTFTFRRKDYI